MCCGKLATTVLTTQLQSAFFHLFRRPPSFTNYPSLHHVRPVELSVPLPDRPSEPLAASFHPLPACSLLCCVLCLSLLFGSAGLFGCFDDCGICLTACICPCVQYGLNQDRLHPGVSHPPTHSLTHSVTHNSQQPAVCARRIVRPANCLLRLMRLCWLGFLLQLLPVLLLPGVRMLLPHAAPCRAAPQIQPA